MHQLHQLYQLLAVTMHSPIAKPMVSRDARIHTFPGPPRIVERTVASVVSYFYYHDVDILLCFSAIFSSPGRSPGRAIVLPPALALASALTKC